MCQKKLLIHESRRICWVVSKTTLRFLTFYVFSKFKNVTFFVFWVVAPIFSNMGGSYQSVTLNKVPGLRLRPSNRRGRGIMVSGIGATCMWWWWLVTTTFESAGDGHHHFFQSGVCNFSSNSKFNNIACIKIPIFPYTLGKRIVFFLLPEAFCDLKYAENAIAAGAPTQTPLGELTTLP